MDKIDYFPFDGIRSPGRFIAIDFDEINCPICQAKYAVRWLVNSNLEIGEKWTSVDIHTGDLRVVSGRNYWGKESVVPYSIILRKEVFMNRERFVPKLLEFGSFDQFMNFRFRERLLGVWW